MTKKTKNWQILACGLAIGVLIMTVPLYRSHKALEASLEALRKSDVKVSHHVPLETNDWYSWAAADIEYKRTMLTHLGYSFNISDFFEPLTGPSRRSSKVSPGEDGEASTDTRSTSHTRND